MECSSGNNTSVDGRDTEKEAQSHQHQENGRPEPTIRGHLSLSITQPPDTCTDHKVEESHANNCKLIAEVSRKRERDKPASIHRRLLLCNLAKRGYTVCLNLLLGWLPCGQGFPCQQGRTEMTLLVGQG